MRRKVERNLCRMSHEPKMPRPIVYGKRPTKQCSDFAIFNSPQRRNPVKFGSDETEALLEKVTGLKLRDYADGVEDERKRRVILGDRDANRGVESKVKTKEKKSGGKGQKMVEDDIMFDAIKRAKKEKDPGVEVVQLEVLHETKPTKLVATQSPQDPVLSEQTDHSTRSPRLREQHDVPLFENGVEVESTAAQTRRYQPDCLKVIGLETDLYTTHTSTLLSLSQHPLIPFVTWSHELSEHFDLTKIAEASFGEVYRLSLISTADIPGFSRRDESVLKVIALTPPAAALPTNKKQRAAVLKQAEVMSKPADVASEVRVLQRMREVPGFTNFRDLRIVQGRPPPLFCEAFNAFNDAQKAKGKDLSHFPDPAKKASYGDDQLWAVIEMQDAGTDLERAFEHGQRSVWEVWDVFWQVVLSLAKGEEGAEFEHRDLHLGNICVRPRGDGFPSAGRMDIKKNLGFTDLETTIIDYTISRCRLNDSAATEQDADIAFTDLSTDPCLFEGDSTEDYQYDIYRYMRGAVYSNDCFAAYPPHFAGHAKGRHTKLSDDASSTAKSLPNNTKAASSCPWQLYHPETNLVWLHYILYSLLESMTWPSSLKAPAKKIDSKPNQAHAEWKRANDLEFVLLRVQELLCPETGICKNEMRSASDLVALTLEESWLDVEDVIACHGVEAKFGASAGYEASGRGHEEVPIVPMSDVPSSELLAHLNINVDVMEALGLEAAEQEAKSRRREQRRQMAIAPHKQAEDAMASAVAEVELIECPSGSDPLADSLTHLQINVDADGEHGLEVAVKEARRSRKGGRTGKK